jgi:hypothetical protein
MCALVISRNIGSVGVSAATGDGIDKLFEKVRRLDKELSICNHLSLSPFFWHGLGHMCCVVVLFLQIDKAAVEFTESYLPLLQR